jgi:hypothetical protein
MFSLKKLFFFISGIVIVLNIIASVWGVYDRALLKGTDNPYHNEWPFYLAVLLIMTLSGYSFLKPTSRIIRYSVFLIGLLIGFLLIIVLLWLATGLSGNQEGYLYVSVALIPMSAFVLVLISLLMKKSDLKKNK